MISQAMIPPSNPWIAPKYRNGRRMNALVAPISFENFDLFALGENLQTNGVERDRDQREAEQAGQDQHQHPPELEQGLNLVCPGRIQLRLLHFRQFRQFVAQSVQPLRPARFGINDEGVGQRILVQAADHVGQPTVLLEAIQRLRA